MKSKRAIMGFAALLILFFHFYPVLFNVGVEKFLQKSAYIGVDLFFLVSAMSLGKKSEIPFFSFLWDRIKKVYLPFAVFCIVAAAYKKWAIKKLLMALLFAELFNRGGGAYLWFFPGIMIFYLCVPFILKLKKKFGLWSLLGLLLVWVGLAAVLQYGFNYKTIFILLNRLPIFLIGLYYDRVRAKQIKLPIRIAATVILFVLGQFLLYKYGRLAVPFKDMYYVVAIPAVLAWVEVFELLYSIKGFKLRGLEMLGGCTLEVYALQMTFGYDIMGFIVKQKAHLAVAFILTLLILIAAALLISFLKKFIVEKVNK